MYLDFIGEVSVCSMQLANEQVNTESYKVVLLPVSRLWRCVEMAMRGPVPVACLYGCSSVLQLL